MAPDSNAELNDESETHRAAQVFRLEGEYWTVQFDGLVCRLKDTRGMQLLAALLARQGEWVAAIELAGRPPSAASPTHDAERARGNVTRHLSSAVKRIAACHPTLGRHLATTLHTGTQCSYMPDARLSVRWQGCV